MWTNVAVAFRVRQLSPDQTEELGRYCAALLTEKPQWIFRRRESVTVIDEATVRRQQSVDFTLDTLKGRSEFAGVCDRVFGKGICAAPLFILDKDPASSLAFDLQDESGRSLPLMTTEENGEVSAATLKVLCEDHLKTAGFPGLPSALASKLEELARSDAVDGKQWLDRLENPLLGDDHQPEIASLLGDGQMKGWLVTLAHNSIVMVAFEDDGHHRRVIKIVYEQPMTKGPTPPALLALRSFKILLDIPLMRSARYHFDVKAPQDFRLTQVALKDKAMKQPLRAPGVRRWAQVYLDDVNDARGAVARFGLRVSGQGVLGGALVASCLVLAAILMCIKYRVDIVEDSGAGPALLLVLPGVIATYVARLDQHGLTTRLLAVPRWILLICSGVSAYYAAGVIALVGHVEEGLKPHAYEAAVTKQASEIDQLLQFPMFAAVAAVIVIGLGWLCTRETTHRVLRACQGAWGWRRYLKVRFRLKVTMRAPLSAVREHVQREIGKLEAKSKLRNTMIDSEPEDVWAIHRSLGPLRWTHGIQLTNAPSGTLVNWVFWANGPTLAKPILLLLMAWERLMAACRIRAFRRANPASEQPAAA